VCLIMQLRQDSVTSRIKFNFLTKMVIDDIRVYFLSTPAQLEKPQLIHIIEILGFSTLHTMVRMGYPLFVIESL